MNTLQINTIRWQEIAGSSFGIKTLLLFYGTPVNLFLLNEGSCYVFLSKTIVESLLHLMVLKYVH